jgi:hypothetical protein
MRPEFTIRILTSALAAKAIPRSKDALGTLAQYSEAQSVAKMLDCPQLIRELRLARNLGTWVELPELDQKNRQVLWGDLLLGEVQILHKSSIPGELQSRLAIESTIDRFLEYLQKVHQIAVLDESARHVQVFIPVTAKLEGFKGAWENFLTEVAFSDYGKYQLAGLVQTFITMLNAVTLSSRGFSTLDVPILTESQALVLAAWYRAVIRDVKNRQSERKIKIDQLKKGVANSDLSEKERKAQQKDLDDKTAMQIKEAQKYTEYFRKSFIAGLQAQDAAWEELETIQKQLSDLKTTKAEQKKLQKQQEKLTEKVSLSRSSIKQKLEIFKESGDDPFKFVDLDEEAQPEKFSRISAIAKTFSKTATDQINSTRGDIFTQCISEMYRLLEMSTDDLETLPPSLLTEQLIFPRVRSPGDDSKEFCYSCGVSLDPKKARWQVLRFMFERPSQRRQSSSGEGRPHICISCAALSFASPLKVTDESIIVKLEAKGDSTGSELKIKDYIRMLTSKEMHLSAGRYLVLTSEKTSSGDLVSQKLGQVQYALSKIASIFPVEVLSDFNFSLITQGTQLSLEGRHLVLLKGLMDCYRQFFLASSKEVNMALGDAIRYVQQDLPYLADYRLTRESSYSTDFELEKIRGLYWKIFISDLGDYMDTNNQIPKRARLYRDVAALTGLTYAFAQSLESTAKKLMKQDDAEREVSKLIEKVDDVIAFSYYATLGDEEKTSVQARLYKSPDSSFIYSQTKWLLGELDLLDREDKDDKGNHYLQLYADDISRAYQHFSISNHYAQERDWKELTYNLKLSLYTRFPELVRKLKSTSENK